MSSLRSSIDSLVLFYVFVLCSTLRVCDHHSYCPKPFGSKSVSNYQRFLSFFSQSWIIWVIAGLYSDWSFGKPNACYSAHLEILPLDEGWSTLGTAGKIWDLAKELPHGRFFCWVKVHPANVLTSKKIGGGSNMERIPVLWILLVNPTVQIHVFLDKYW